MLSLDSVKNDLTFIQVHFSGLVYAIKNFRSILPDFNTVIEDNEKH